MKLYYYPPMASLAILILACELNMPIELVRFDPLTRRVEDGRLLSQISAKDCIPVLERDDGSILTETPVILDWLAAQDRALRFSAPAHSEEHLQIAQWMAYFASEQHKFYTMLFWDIDAAAKAEVVRRLLGKFPIVVQAAARAPYLVAGRYSIADIYLFIMIRGLHLVEGLDLEASYPALAAFRDRVSRRPAVARAMALHGTTEVHH